MASIAFPYELYSAIIHFATYSPVCFNISPPQSWPVSYYNGAYQADYKTKKALTLVSRQFRSLSLPVLYEAVEVHKVSSIQRLADVLDTTSPGSTTRGPQNPRKIKHLFVSVLDVRDKKRTIAVFNCLQRIFFRCCRHLLGFGFYSTWLHYTDRYSKPRNWLMSIPKSVRFLDWQGPSLGCNFTLIVNRASESLIALRFSKVHLIAPPSMCLPSETDALLNTRGSRR